MAGSYTASEAQIQKSIIATWRSTGTPGSLIAHIANGEHRDKATAGRLRSMGVLAGMPDLICVSPTDGLFFIELKRPGGKLSSAQSHVIETMRSAGIDVYVIDGIDEAMALLRLKGILKPDAIEYGATKRRTIRG
jgi:hypothetical protein